VQKVSGLQFRVTSSRYDNILKRLHFTVSGERDGTKFTVASAVPCLRDPKTPENTHLVTLIALTNIFKLPSASGR
jgi:hypothetical protein